MAAKEMPVDEFAQQAIDRIRQVVVGKENALFWVTAVILAGGHILLEDIPGVGKTTMAIAFSRTLGLSYNRVQFTPDVLPSDVTGYSVPDQTSGEMVYRPGAVLCNLFLADELNRATSRTQSALLEAMEEGQVTVDGIAHPLPRPFVVIATQNPTGAAGTQLLPDSQMDRFAIRLSLGYPGKADEVAMVLGRQGKNPMAALKPLGDQSLLTAMQEEVANTYIHEAVVNYAVELMGATRNHSALLRGGSPRATLSVVAVAKAIARLRGRDYIVPGDIQEVFLMTMDHRVLLTTKAKAEGVTAREVLRQIVNSVTAPKIY